MVIMHQEKWLDVIRPTADDSNSNGLDRQVSAVQKASKYDKPVEFHYALITKDTSIGQTCNVQDFHSYLVRYSDDLPWGLHAVKGMNTTAVNNTYCEITQSSTPTTTLDFNRW